MKWRYLNSSTLALVNDHGKVVAQIYDRGLAGGWKYKGDVYIDKESAQQAAEQQVGMQVEYRPHLPNSAAMEIRAVQDALKEAQP